MAGSTRVLPQLQPESRQRTTANIKSAFRGGPTRAFDLDLGDCRGTRGCSLFLGVRGAGLQGYCLSVPVELAASEICGSVGRSGGLATTGQEGRMRT